MDAPVDGVFTAVAAAREAKVPATCRAAFITEFKSINEQDFTPREVPTPKCGDGMILLRTHAASINPVDSKFVEGSIPGPRPFLTSLATTSPVSSPRSVPGWRVLQWATRCFRATGALTRKRT